MRNLRRMPFIKMFMPKRRNRGALWASLLGIGVSAAVFGVSRGKGMRRGMLPITNAVKNISPKLNFEGLGNIAKKITPNMNINRMDNGALTEFSEEVLQSALNKR